MDVGPTVTPITYMINLPLPDTLKLSHKNITKRIRSHLESNDLLNRYQSAYRPIYSTETALLKVQNDLSRNLDHGKTTVLDLLEPSAAFDTLDHSGVIGLALEWYLWKCPPVVCLISDGSTEKG